MREARRQKNIKETDVPTVCLLDPDGDLVRHLRRTGRAKPFAGWPCYHTELDVFSLTGRDVGIVGRAVGASFAVLVAEKLFAGGCRLLISLTSSGQIVPSGPPPYFIIIDRALRDEGTSYHYASPSEYAIACPRLLAWAVEAVKQDGPRTITGATWTTDAPFRETSEAIQAAADKGILAVEMEAAALYAFSAATDCKVLCLALLWQILAIDRRNWIPESDFQ
jgi:uridine phosphorylase